MKAVTLQQPWAWAIIHGGKDIENRTRIGTWRPALNSRIAIHAGKRWSDPGIDSPLVRAAAQRAGWAAGVGYLALLATVPMGAIIGTVEVVDVHPDDCGCCKPWGDERFWAAPALGSPNPAKPIVHLALADPQPCDPIPYRGALGLWTVPADVAAVLA